MSEIDNLLLRFDSGDRQALARLISMVENRQDDLPRILDRVYSKVGKAYRIGITGPPGAGKSTIVNTVVAEYRKSGLMVGVIAVDPSSPFSGGALLGDRVRMTKIGLDPGVFIRSLATRGSVGGLSRAAGDVADVMDAFGKDLIIYETVGVGQSELEIVQHADTTIVVLVPEMGDGIQAMKAGLMEIADFFVLNKADHAGADRSLMEIEAILQLAKSTKPWNPPVIKSVAINNEGIDDIIAQIHNHRQYLETSGELAKQRRQKLLKKYRRVVEDAVLQVFWTDDRTRLFMRGFDEQDSPYRISQRLIQGAIKDAKSPNRSNSTQGK
jgi:LAO/AO transport system kinase